MAGRWGGDSEGVPERGGPDARFLGPRQCYLWTVPARNLAPYHRQTLVPYHAQVRRPLELMDVQCVTRRVKPRGRRDARSEVPLGSAQNRPV